MNRTLTITLAILGTLAASVTALAGVSTESPFAPRGFGPNGVASNSPIELRGITSDERGMRFAIYDPAKKEGAWVRIDEQSQPYVIRSYDAATNHIVVDYQGRSQTLALADPKFGPGKTVAMPVAAVPQQAQQGNLNPNDPRAQRQQFRQQRQGQGGQPGAQQQGGQQQQQAQPSAAESARIDAIRAEIARRRSQRTDGGGQGQ